MKISFFVPGIPKPAGSKRSMINPKTRKAITIDANKATKPWQADVKFHAAKAASKLDPVMSPVELKVYFFFPRPKCHFRTGKFSHVLKDTAPYLHSQTPDLSKLLRAVEDAMIGVVYHDDRQIALTVAKKKYGKKPGAYISIKTI